MLQFKNKKTVYYLGMIFVILSWGVSPVVSKPMFNYYTPALWNVVNGVISVTSMLIISCKKLHLLNWTYFKVAVPTGLCYSLASLTQKAGLEITSPAMYAFLENTTCIFVPLLMLLLVKEKLTPAKLTSALLCLVGVFILCGVLEEGGLQFGMGEILCALAGLFYSVNIAGTGAFAKKLDTGLYLLIQFSIHTVLSIGSALILPRESLIFSWNPLHILAMVTILFVCIVLSWLIRTMCLQHLDPTFVAVATPFTAVIAGVLSVIVGSDALTVSLVVGALLILAAILLSGLADNKKKASKPEPNTEPCKEPTQ